MTANEFLSSMKSNGAEFAPPADLRAITVTSMTLQQMRAAILPVFIQELYKIAGGGSLGNGYIFGPNEFMISGKFPISTIVQINGELAAIDTMRGKTVFGRNDLFWFAFDAFGVCFMLDNLSLKPLRKYDDPYRALTDCLIVGKM